MLAFVTITDLKPHTTATAQSQLLPSPHTAAAPTLVLHSQALKAARDQVAACEQAIKAAERQLSELELAVPKARMEAEAEAAKAEDIQQRLDELKAATKVGGMVNRLVSHHQPF